MARLRQQKGSKGDDTMYHIAHIEAYWRHRAMQYPGGAALEEHRGMYWAAICHMNTADRLSR